MDKRTFDTGATRDADTDKHDPEGFLSPLALQAFNEYMHKNRQMKDGSMRDSDNWQKGIPFTSYMKSIWRHFFDVWKGHRGYRSNEPLRTALCALLFNVMGYLHELERRKPADNPANAKIIDMPDPDRRAIKAVWAQPAEEGC